MVYIDYLSISEALSEFGYSLPDEDDLMTKSTFSFWAFKNCVDCADIAPYSPPSVNSLATEFNLDVDDFIDELLASVVNMKKVEVDLVILEHMEGVGVLFFFLALLISTIFFLEEHGDWKGKTPWGVLLEAIVLGRSDGFDVASLLEALLSVPRFHLSFFWLAGAVFKHDLNILALRD